MEVSANISLSPLSALSHLEENRGCFECQIQEVTHFVPDLGIFVCKDCAVKISSLQISVKSIEYDIFTELEVEKAKNGGNAAFRAYVETWEIREKYTGDRTEEYRLRLQAKAKGQTLLSDDISHVVDSTLGWLGSKIARLAEGFNTKMGNSAALGKVGGLINTAYSAYDAQVEKHIVSERGFLHPLKRQMDEVTAALQPKTGNYQQLLAGTDSSARDIELIS